MIGYYNYTVVLTFMSLISAITGIFFAINGVPVNAIVCLALSGFFDMLDGPVARTKTDRSHDELLFGIQLDSLCDLVAFGVLPAVICFTMGVSGPIGFLALIYYVMAGVIRLCYFNVRETNNFFSEESHEKVFIGLPITSISVIFPVLFLVSLSLTEEARAILFIAMLIVVGTLFIANFKMRKPKMSLLIVLCVVVAIVIIVALFIQFPNFAFFA